MVVELKKRVQGGFAIELPATLAFEHPTIGNLVGYLIDTLFPRAVRTAAAATQGSGRAMNAVIADVQRKGMDELEAMIDQELRDLLQ